MATHCNAFGAGDVPAPFLNWKSFPSYVSFLQRCVHLADCQKLSGGTLIGRALIYTLFFITVPLAASVADDNGPDIAPRVEACAACHGEKGKGTGDPYFPRLAGKPAGYLFNQLVAFKNGRRSYPPMNYLLEFLPEAYLRQMAVYYAAQRPPFLDTALPESSADLLAQGERLVTGGDASRGIPACVSCHGKTLTGMEPAIPGLLGLRAKYISAQLGAWRYGTRTARAPDCMQIVAGLLTEDDVQNVAAWLASRPAAADPSPAPRDSYPLPFACGSQSAEAPHEP